MTADGKRFIIPWDSRLPSMRRSSVSIRTKRVGA